MDISNESDLINQLQEAENYRLNKKKRLRINLIQFLIVPATAIPIMVMVQDDHSDWFYGLFAFIFFNLIFTIIVFFRVHKAYTNYYNKNIQSKIVSILLPNTKFITMVKREVIVDLWHKSQPFRLKKPEGVIATGVVGKFKDTTFELYDAHISKVRKGKRTNLFSGVLMKVKRNKEISTPIYISTKSFPLTDPIENILGSVGLMSKIEIPPPMVVAGSDAFISKFDIYCQSQEYANEILTEEITFQIIQMRTENDHPWFFISFVKDYVYLIEYNILDLTSIELSQSVLDKDTISKNFKPIFDKVEFLTIFNE